MKTLLKYLLVLVLCIFVSKPLFSTVSISGTILYGSSNSGITYIKVILLKKQSGTNIYDTIFKSATDSIGYYHFDNLQNGDYKIVLKHRKSFGGLTSLDATKILEHFTGMNLLQQPFLAAADVSADGSVNSLDALYVSRRISGSINSFPSGDWYMTVPAPFNYNGTALTYNITVLCYGDVNGSYSIPTSFECKDAILDIDNRGYWTVLSDTQCWMQENLNTGKTINWASEQTDNDTIEKYEVNSSQCGNEGSLTYGSFYSWPEAIQYQNISQDSNVYHSYTYPALSGNVRGICPLGWHIPSADEFSTLFSTWAGNPDSSVVRLREQGQSHWCLNQSNYINGTNSSKWTALGAGSIVPMYSDTGQAWNGYGDFPQMFIEEYGYTAFWWTSTETRSPFSPVDANWARSVEFLDNYPAPDFSFGPKQYAYSVRCIKD